MADTKRVMREGEAERYLAGPRALSALLPRIVRPVMRRRAPGAGQLLADWEAIVGPAIAAVTAPKRLAAGVLHLACAGPVALELQHLSGELIARINAHFGSKLVERLKLTQESLPPRARPSPPAPPSPTVVAAVERRVADLPEGPLRDALRGLGEAVLTPRARRPSRG